MPLQRKRITRLGDLLRKARRALDLEQSVLARQLAVSARTHSRWENGAVSPTPEQRERIVDVLQDAPADVLAALADHLRVELVHDHTPGAAPAPLVAPPPPAPAPPPAAPAPPPVDVRAALDSVVFAAADEHDVVPRKLRAFGVALLRRVEELGVPLFDAAAQLAAKERR